MVDRVHLGVARTSSGRHGQRVGTFQAENIHIGSESNVATVGATVTWESAIALVTASLADGIYYQGGGVDDYQEAGDQTVGVSAAFNITFPVLAGNPYGSKTVFTDNVGV